MTGLPVNRILHGDCVQVMRGIPAESVDFVLTDPPYGVRYRDRAGRTVANDDRLDWLRPAFAGIYRLMNPDTLALSFYGWNQVDRFADAWKAAGFVIVGHLVFAKRYASSSRFFGHRHEQAYLLAKGTPPLPAEPLPDILDWRYSGNRLHPTEKHPECLTPLVRAFCRPGGVVLDPFCGSGSSLVAARDAGCAGIGIELDEHHHHTATNRLGGTPDEASTTHVLPWARPFTRYALASYSPQVSLAHAVRLGGRNTVWKSIV